MPVFDYILNFTLEQKFSILGNLLLPQNQDFLLSFYTNSYSTMIVFVEVTMVESSFLPFSSICMKFI